MHRERMTLTPGMLSKLSKPVCCDLRVHTLAASTSSCDIGHVYSFGGCPCSVGVLATTAFMKRRASGSFISTFLASSVTSPSASCSS